MDMASRFWQIEIKERNKYKIIYAILEELYEYNIIFFRLKEILVIF